MPFAHSIFPGRRKSAEESESDIVLVPQHEIDFEQGRGSKDRSISSFNQTISSPDLEYTPHYDLDPARRRTRDSTHVRNWPAAPMTLGMSKFDIVHHLCHDLFMILVPIPFFVLAGAVVRRNGHVVDNHDWEKIQNATRVAVTIFPITFAAVAGRAFKSLASWRLERGVKLGLIEQLIGSQTFFNTFTTQFFLRSYNLIGLGLVAFWCLSPLGGQSSLHLISTTGKPVKSNSSILYLNTRADSDFASGGDFKGILPPLNALYFSSLMAPESIKSSSMDLWGNVKIPRLSNLQTKASSDGWQDVPQFNASYTSLMGVPIAGLPRDKNTTFTMESTYFDLECLNATLGNEINITSISVVAGQKPNTTYSGADGSSTCQQDTDCVISFSIAMDRFAASQTFGDADSLDAEPPVKPIPPTVLFQSRYWGDSRFEFASTRAFFRLQQIYVETTIHCDFSQSQPNCTVSSMRPSRRPHPDPSITSLSFSSVLWNFAVSLASSAGGGHEATSSPTELYIANPAAPLMIDNSEGLALWQLPLQTLSIRLTQIFNSYWQGSINPQAMVGDFANVPFQTFEGPPGNITTPANSTTLVDTYVCNWGWLSLYLLATSAFFLAAVAGVILDNMTIAPDILGFCSSLTRDTPYVRLPKGGSTLDGFERARLLKDMRVRLGDVKSERLEAGYVAFGSDGLAGRPAKGRYYD